MIESSKFFYHISRAKAGSGQSHSGCTTTTTSHPSSSLLLFCRPIFLLFSAGAALADDAEPPPQPAPHHPEPAPGGLARSPALFYRGGDTFGAGNDDVAKTRADDDYVADITAPQGSWAP